MVIAITGHRPNKLNNEYGLDGPCTRYIKKQIVQILEDEKPYQIISGMALGVDTLFALIGIEMNIFVIAAIPFEGQESKWPKKSQILYTNIINHDLVDRHYISKAGYDPEKMQVRNEWMVDNCDKLIAVYDGSSGGTGNCVKYAKSKNKNILYINPKGYLA